MSDPDPAIAPDPDPDPDGFSARAFYEASDEPDLTEEDVLGDFGPEMEEMIAEVEDRLRAMSTSKARHCQAGRYTEARRRLHDRVIAEVLTPEVLAGAIPEEGR